MSFTVGDQNVRRRNEQENWRRVADEVAILVQCEYTLLFVSIKTLTGNKVDLRCG